MNEPGSARRFFRTTAFVGLWLALGLVLRAAGEPWSNGNLYLVLGVPLTLLCQRVVRREPLGKLWVKHESPTPRRNAALAGVAAAIAPVYSLDDDLRHHHWPQAAWSIGALGGAVGVGYAVAHATKRDAIATLGALGTAGLVGAGLNLLKFAYGGPHAEPRYVFMLTRFAVFLPVMFTLEEVSFRGLVDADLAPIGRWTVLVSSALWGLWHLGFEGLHLAPAISMAVVHTLVGVPLALWYRRTGNLLVSAVTHALLDAMRDGLSR